MNQNSPNPVSSTLAPPPSGPYSAAMRVGDLLYISGNGPFGPAPERARLGTTFAEQAHVVFDNIEHLAREAGTSLAHTVRLGVWISDDAHFPELNRVCGERLTEPYPVRTTVPAPLTRFDIEVDAVIWIPGTED